MQVTLFGAANVKEEIYNLMNKFRNSHNVKHITQSSNKNFMLQIMFRTEPG